jgi:hypothetical protein
LHDVFPLCVRVDHLHNRSADRRLLVHIVLLQDDTVHFVVIDGLILKHNVRVANSNGSVSVKPGLQSGPRGLRHRNGGLHGGRVDRLQMCVKELLVRGQRPHAANA